MSPPQPSGDVGQTRDGRLTFQEMTSLVPLPDRLESGNTIKRFMSRRKAWRIGDDVPLLPNTLAYGGYPYSQAGLAAWRALAEIQTTSAALSGRQYGIHTIHGYFPEGGLTDRPYIYEVTTIAANPGFYNMLVTARQPRGPSTNPAGDFYPPADAELPMGLVCFNALVSFRPTSPSELKGQEPSAQSRFEGVLGSRVPSAWDPAPSVDVPAFQDNLPRVFPTAFPAVDMRKVDMTAYNEGRPLHERRELIFYRLLAPLPADDPNAHILVHAYAADRNGLLMTGNHAGLGYNLGRTVSLSYTFVVHVNSADAVMRYGEAEDADVGQWWLQEACFPRVDADRGIIMCKIWSPEGVHVATEYQDGILRPARRSEVAKGKL